VRNEYQGQNTEVTEDVEPSLMVNYIESEKVVFITSQDMTLF